MNFIELISEFERMISESLKYELLEQHYMNYSFGSGFSAYRIKGRNVKVVYDGKDFLTSIYISAPHEKYPSVKWDRLFFGKEHDLFNLGIIELIKILK